ncbi:MAG: tRNA adenosine(34) deaminase TadA [Coxiella sp. (in: Bacteria)]|nr:MAG: tRNA adenosine(34) deaminase TadA [Coxiella sp. (in: g-proteobacteria)]
MTDDIQFMQLALQQAQHAASEGEVPVGAVLVNEGQVIASGFNQPISSCDPTAHAEIKALRAGADTLRNYRLVGTTLYVTLEPCLMCLGAIVHARVKRLVYGASDPKVGAVERLFDRIDKAGLNHALETRGGVLADDCADLLTSFFRQRR